VESDERVAFALHGVSERLFVRQAIEVVGEHCQTVSYAYRCQSGDDKSSWLLRWGVLPRTAASRLTILSGSSCFRRSPEKKNACNQAFRKRMKGLEPSTFCMASRRSSQLSYIRARGPV
jgi:hypothetical protein